MRTPKQIAEEWIDCTCDEAYTKRGLVAPDCPLHSFSVEEAIADAQKEAKSEGIRELFAALNGFFNALDKQKTELIEKIRNENI